jgi:hypothetical protein
LCHQFLKRLSAGWLALFACVYWQSFPDLPDQKIVSFDNGLGIANLFDQAPESINKTADSNEPFS